MIFNEVSKILEKYNITLVKNHDLPPDAFLIVSANKLYDIDVDITWLQCEDIDKRYEKSCLESEDGYLECGNYYSTPIFTPH